MHRPGAQNLFSRLDERFSILTERGEREFSVTNQELFSNFIAAHRSHTWGLQAVACGQKKDKTPVIISI